MGQTKRAACMDVSNTIDISDVEAVHEAVVRTLRVSYAEADFAAIGVLFRDFSRLYSGSFPGYRACDIRYHNEQHVLDVTLAMARLLDGHARAEAPHSLGSDRALAGIATALFHDSGYIRRSRDTRHSNGAAYTRVHVSRGARFLAEYLPTLGLDWLIGPCTRIIHFTGYEIEPGNLVVADEAERVLGTLLGTADLIAQMADVDYIGKCRECLYEEFVAGGIAGSTATVGRNGTIYESPEELLRMTPAFIHSAIHDRLDDQFNGVHHYAATHFDGRHLYMEAIEHNCQNLETLLSQGYA